VASLCKNRVVCVVEVVLFGLCSGILEDIRELSAVGFEEPERCAYFWYTISIEWSPVSVLCGADTDFCV
jgi:hypothetical protein